MKRKFLSFMAARASRRTANGRRAGRFFPRAAIRTPFMPGNVLVAAADGT